MWKTINMKESHEKFLKNYWEIYSNIHYLIQRDLQRYWFEEFEKNKDNWLVDFEKEYFSIREKILFLLCEWNEFDIFYEKMKFVYWNKFTRIKEEYMEQLFEYWFEKIYKFSKIIWFLDENDEIIDWKDTCYWLRQLLFMIEEFDWKDIEKELKYKREYNKFFDEFWHKFYKMNEDRINFLIDIWFEKIDQLYKIYHSYFKENNFVDFYYDMEIDDKEEKDFYEIKWFTYKIKEILKENKIKQEKEIIKNTKFELKNLYEEVKVKKKFIWYEYEENYEKFFNEYWLRFSGIKKEQINELILFWFEEFQKLLKEKEDRWWWLVYDKDKMSWMYSNLYLELLMSDEEHKEYKNYFDYFRRYWNSFANSIHKNEILKIDFQNFEEKVWFIRDEFAWIKEKFLLYKNESEDLKKINKDWRKFYCDYCKINHILDEEIIDSFIKYNSLKCRKEEPGFFKKNNRSEWEVEVFDFAKRFLQLKKDEIEYTKRISMKWINWSENKNNYREVDIYIDSLKKWIEFNWTYYHQRDKNQDKKRRMLLKKWVNVFFVWEDLWYLKKEACKSKLKRFLWKNKNLIELSHKISKIDETRSEEFIKENELKIENDFWEYSIWLFVWNDLRIVVNYHIENEKTLKIDYFTYKNSYKWDFQFILNYLKDLHSWIESIEYKHDNEFWSWYEFENLWFKKIWEIWMKSHFTWNHNNKWRMKTNENWKLLEIYDYWFTIFELKV